MMLGIKLGDLSEVDKELLIHLFRGYRHMFYQDVEVKTGVGTFVMGKGLIDLVSFMYALISVSLAKEGGAFSNIDERIRFLHESGWTNEEIAREVGISTRTLRRRARAMGLPRMSLGRRRIRRKQPMRQPKVNEDGNDRSYQAKV